MTATTLSRAVPTARNDIYRAVWRWHFYAGLLVLPFLVWLALTGGLVLFKDEIDGQLHRALKTVPPSAGPMRDAGELVAAALAQHPGTLRSFTVPARPDASAEVGIVTAGGERRTVYVDPYRAQVLGELPHEGTVAWTIRKLHSLKFFSAWARGAIEIAAGWAVLLVLTGVYLWWPRGQRGGVVSVRGRPAQRVFWRDLHAVTGLAVGAVLLFLAVTGMPWSVLWGAQVNRWANGHNFGYPAGVRVQLPMSQALLPEGGHTAWSLAQARVPESVDAAADKDDPHAGHGDHAGHAAPQAALPRGMIGLDAALARFAQQDIAPGHTVLLPQGPRGVYTASVYPDDLARQRVIHLDAYSGRVLLDMGYADYGPLGRTLEWGINVHMGQQYGRANQWLLALACAAIVLLCASAGAMWWKRRPAGRLGVPPPPTERRVLYGVLALLAIGGIVFPLVGASMAVMAVVDAVVQRRGPAAA